MKTKHTSKTRNLTVEIDDTLYDGLQTIRKLDPMVTTVSQIVHKLIANEINRYKKLSPESFTDLELH